MRSRAEISHYDEAFAWKHKCRLQLTNQLVMSLNHLASVCGREAFLGIEKAEIETMIYRGNAR